MSEEDKTTDTLGASILAVCLVSWLGIFLWSWLYVGDILEVIGKFAFNG